MQMMLRMPIWKCNFQEHQAEQVDKLIEILKTKHHWMGPLIDALIRCGQGAIAKEILNINDQSAQNTLWVAIFIWNSLIFPYVSSFLKIFLPQQARTLEDPDHLSSIKFFLPSVFPSSMTHFWLRSSIPTPIKYLLLLMRKGFAKLVKFCHAKGLLRGENDPVVLEMLDLSDSSTCACTDSSPPP